MLFKRNSTLLIARAVRGCSLKNIGIYPTILWPPTQTGHVQIFCNVEMCLVMLSSRADDRSRIGIARLTLDPVAVWSIRCALNSVFVLGGLGRHGQNFSH